MLSWITCLKSELRDCDAVLSLLFVFSSDRKRCHHQKQRMCDGGSEPQPQCADQRGNASVWLGLGLHMSPAGQWGHRRAAGPALHDLQHAVSLSFCLSIHPSSLCPISLWCVHHFWHWSVYQPVISLSHWPVGPALHDLQHEVSPSFCLSCHFVISLSHSPSTLLCLSIHPSITFLSLQPMMCPPISVICPSMYVSICLWCVHPSLSLVCPLSVHLSVISLPHLSVMCLPTFVTGLSIPVLLSNHPSVHPADYESDLSLNCCLESNCAPDIPQVTAVAVGLWLVADSVAACAVQVTAVGLVADSVASCVVQITAVEHVADSVASCAV